MSIADTLAERTDDRPRLHQPAVVVDSRQTIDILDTPSDILDLRSEWLSLEQSNTANSLYFQSFFWLATWISISGARLQCASHRLAIVVVRFNGRLALICPFVLKQKRGLSHLCWAGGAASQYGDVVCDGGDASRALINDALEYAIAELKPDVVHLRKVRNDAAIQTWLEAANARPTEIDSAPFQAFPHGVSFDDYCAKYSSKSRKNRRRLRRRLSETGEIITEVLKPGKAAQAAIDTALAFKHQWLLDRGHLSSALRDDDVRLMLREFVSQTNPLTNSLADPSVEPFVSIMRRDDGTTLSVQFGLISKQKLALHMIAYNPETEKSGAGVLHMEDTIRHCIETGLEELDFLAPDASYKRDWADDVVTVADYVVARSLKGRLYAQAYLNGTRHLLKSSVETLPLSFRKNLALHWHKQ